MFGKIGINRLISTFTIAAVLLACASLVAAAEVDGEITVTGSVMVNGQKAVSNSTIVSGATITTKDNSSAVVNLGTNGKVELLPNSELTLNFSDSNITAMLKSGAIRVMNGAGIGSVVTTNSATVVGDTATSNSYTVNIACGVTLVETAAGMATLRTPDSTKQVAAGTDAASGNLPQTGCKECTRSGGDACTPVAGVGGGTIAAIVAAAGAAVVGAMFLSREENVSQFGGATIVSPIS